MPIAGRIFLRADMMKERYRSSSDPAGATGRRYLR